MWKKVIFWTVGIIITVPAIYLIIFLTYPASEQREEAFTVAHRGGAGYWPENTMVAVDNSLAANYDAIEIDIVPFGLDVNAKLWRIDAQRANLNAGADARNVAEESLQAFMKRAYRRSISPAELDS